MVLKPISETHVFYLVPCICSFFEVLVLNHSHEAPIINVMEIYFAQPYPSMYSRLKYNLVSFQDKDSMYSDKSSNFTL